MQTDGTYDKKQWEAAGRSTARRRAWATWCRSPRSTIEDDRLVLEINGGFKGGRKWYERIEVGVGGSTVPVGRGNSTAPGGTTIALLFPKAFRR